MRPTFTIVWIEDKESVIESQEEKIQAFLDKQGFEMKLLTDNLGNRFEEFLEKEPVDIIITDYNISEDINGLKIVEIIRGKGIIIDILFYSVHDVLDGMYEKLGSCGLIVTWDDKDIIEPLKRLILKNIKRYQDMFFLRGFVISKCIDLELHINKFLEFYFKIPETKSSQFHNFVLENRYNSIVGKQKAIAKILLTHELKTKKDFEGLTTKLGKVIESRNLLAHCKVQDDNTLVSMGETTIFDRARIRSILQIIKAVSEQLDKLTDWLKNNT